MKKMFAAALALSLMSGTAFAAPYNGQQDHNQQNQRPQQSQQHQQPDQHQSKPQAKKSQYEYQGRRYDAVRGPQWHAPKGYDAHRRWSRGDRLPTGYRDRSYVVDYRAYHLKQPPRGYQWVRVNNDVMLVSVGNGLISQVVLSLFY
ncbi:MAG: RcnB family protein [Parvibaculaceae bacterium]